MKKALCEVAVPGLVAFLLLTALTTAYGWGNQPIPPQSNAYGHSLEEWMTSYWNWYFLEGQDEATSLIGHVRLLPLPNGEYSGGEGTIDDPAVFTGLLELSLRPNNAFVLPVLAWLGYMGEAPLTQEYFTTGPVTVKLDGSTLIDQDNVGHYYYGPVALNIPVEADTIGFAQGISFVYHPLSVGTHTLKLDATLRYPTGGDAPLAAVRYVNTWTIHVVP